VTRLTSSSPDPVRKGPENLEESVRSSSLLREERGAGPSLIPGGKRKRPKVFVKAPAREGEESSSSCGEREEKKGLTVGN